MTAEELLDLLCEYGHDMRITRAITAEEEQYGCKYIIAYKGIVCGSNIVPPDFVREYIRRHIEHRGWADGRA